MSDLRPTHIDTLTGSVVFPEGHDAAQLMPLPADYWAKHDCDFAIAAIKAEAERRILEVAPIWRQLNDLADPTSPGAILRRAQINEIRAWSNAAEHDVQKGSKA